MTTTSLKLGFIGLGIMGAPMALHLVAKEIDALGADYIDAPVSGGEVGAKAASLTMVKRSFEPGVRIRLHQKDLGLALKGARELGLSLPQTANAAQLMQACAANGMADLDHSALVKALELMAGHAVA